MTLAELTLLVFTLGVIVGIVLSIAVVSFGSTRVDHRRDVRKFHDMRKEGQEHFEEVKQDSKINR